MAAFKWIANDSLPGGTDYLAAANLVDLTAATPLPNAGDSVGITGIADAGIHRLGALYVFPPLGRYTHIDFFAPQNPLTEIQAPNAIHGYTVTGQILNIDGSAGPADFWLQNSTLQNDTLNVVGTAVVSSYLDSTVSGAINIGTGTATGTLEIEVIPADVSLVVPSDHDPVTTLDATVTIDRGSELDIEAGSGAVSGFINNGAITVAPGGSLAIDDEDAPNPVTNPPLVSFPFEHNLLFANGGSISILGAAGQTTKAAFVADVGGPGSITINGNGAAPSATTLLVAGDLHDQSITLADGTVDVEDASTAIDTPGTDGFDVTGGSFTFADGHGVLILHQAELTSLQFNADDTGQIEVADGRHPFTTPIAGFGAGDVIELPGKNLARFGLSTYTLSYDPGSHLLEVLSPADIAGNPPEVIAALRFAGNYAGGLFHLSGNNATEELDVTYAGAAPPVPLPPDPLVDSAYVFAERPDVAASGMDATTWYDDYGWKEGANPDALFDTRYYLTQNPDVAAAGVNPLQHFEAHGWTEGRDPSLLFSDSKYLAAYPDVAAAGVDPLLHYALHGQSEGRMAFLSGPTAPADPLVNAAYYDPQLGATLIPVGAAAAQQAAGSYAATGWQRGLNPDALFDTRYYLANNPDVAAAHVDPLTHYETYGWHEGRNPSPQFSTSKYLAAYADVRAAGVDPLLHYVEYGQAEGRQAFAV